MKNQCKKKSYFYEIKFNSERFDDNKLLEAMALYRRERGFYHLFQNGIPSPIPIFKIQLLIRCIALGKLQNHHKT